MDELTDYELFITILSLADEMMSDAGGSGTQALMLPSEGGITVGIVAGRSRPWIAYFYPDGKLMEARLGDAWLVRTHLDHHPEDDALPSWA